MEQLSRRNFLALGGAGVAAVGAAATLAEGSVSTAQAEEVAVDDIVDDQLELAIPEGEQPEATEYEADVVVVGCGMAGLHAAAAAADAGASVLVIEKGTPGYGGMTGFAGTTGNLAEGADLETTIKWTSQSNEYLLNQNWIRAWYDEIGPYNDRNTEWGIMADYIKPVDTPYSVDGYFDGTPGHDDQHGYFQLEEVQEYERHKRFVDVLEDKGIPHIDHTMVCDVLESDGRVVGAVALHVPSGQFITIKAKAVILCCGSGTVRSAGYPLGGGAFDGSYICFMHGVPVAGGEFEDYHMAYGDKPGLVLTTSGWDYSEPLACNSHGKAAGTPDDELWSGYYLQQVIFGSCIDGLSDPDPTNISAMKRTPTTGWTAPGAAPGFPLHMTGGAFCGWEDTQGATSLPGLYAAGDGSLASFIGGTCYYAIGGMTTGGSGIQGHRSGEAAAAYVADLDFVDLPSDDVDAIETEIMAPIYRDKGYGPNFVIEQLQNVMASQPVIFRKNEDILNAALTQVEFIRDNYLPKLKALSSHDLRLCREIVQKTNTMEIKLRAGLARKESRGFHYRTDYPYRDDQYLGAFVATKTDDGMEISFVEEPDEWKGDMSLSYEERYGRCYPFPGEAEAKGLE